MAFEPPAPSGFQFNSIQFNSVIGYVAISPQIIGNAAIPPQIISNTAIPPQIIGNAAIPPQIIGNATIPPRIIGNAHNKYYLTKRVWEDDALFFKPVIVRYSVHNPAIYPTSLASPLREGFPFVG